MSTTTRKRLVTAGITAVLATFTVPLAAPPPASAAPLCRDGSVCTWTGNDFTGTKRTSGLNPEGGCYPWGGKTVSNQSGHTITVYSKGSCYGKRVQIADGHWGQTKPGATIQSIAVNG
ncbi:peptidase inhibitor family I36 protein [Nocardioides sp. YIM 152315]|uniref:peptidase inhibitor family I36 protein n=1 Tax=Nocardioides sp. YIM 152315 TaxID=3031760 RepID=UPI0023DBD5BD|nr:peptidase inhibitor family I36 protein [Nocardioides sp. YIM 152315]MDF1603826.1 peptidase inhibitor family I36 protein [Nocardioides sp. YIM 152315]